MVKVLFFAQLKEQLGCGDYDVAVDSTVTLAWLKEHLVKENEHWREHFANKKLLMAVNQEMVDASAQVNDGDEVAFFPPVTGG